MLSPPSPRVQRGDDLAWVIGSGGLLGSALCRALRAQHTPLFLPPQTFCWRDPIQLQSQFAEAVRLFAQLADEAGAWEIYWAAGIGTMGSTPEQLRPETEALANLLQLLQAEPELNRTSGAIALASSAGAIYAGNTDAIVIDETCDPVPTTAYAYEKLKQEELLRAFAQTHSHCAVLLARISTLYGPGSAIGKPQGLITHIARCLLRNQPIQIYVPLDTIRDYITVDDAASMMVSSLNNLNAGDIQTRILASEQPTTIAEVISIFKRITRRNPRIVTSASKLSSVYSRRIQFRTKFVPGARLGQTTSLIVGIAGVMAAERGLYTNTKIIFE